MNIVCPHCTTFFAIDPARLGPSGRTVRCARCKQMWRALPDQSEQPDDNGSGDAMMPTLTTASAADPIDNDAVEWHEPGLSDITAPAEPPIIDSPSIAAGLPGDGAPAAAGKSQVPRFAADTPPRKTWLRRPFDRQRPIHTRRLTLPIACVAMAALVAALLMWRAEIVRLMPQTAGFYNLIGLEVNLRGLAIRGVKVGTETVDNKPVLVIEGDIVGLARRAVELPRLRFALRDAQGREIYAWNTVLEQTALRPGERAAFRSRLAAPPPEGRTVEVRFFNRHDLAAGGV